MIKQEGDSRFSMRIMGERKENRSDKGVGKQSPRALNGSVTVFLSMILLCMISIMCALLHSARLAGSGWYLQTAMNSSLDSLMSKYHREAWERYHLLLLETEGKEALADEFSEYLNQYLECDSVYGLRNENTQIKDEVLVTEDGGSPLEEEILDYMKFGIFTDLGDEASLTEFSEVMRASDGIHAVKESYQIHSEQAFRLEEILEEIQNSLGRQQEMLDECRDELGECRGTAFIKTAEKMAGEMERIPALMEKYELTAELFKKELDESERKAEQKREEIGETAWEALKGQMDSYRSYTDAEGERRLEVERIAEETQKNREIVEESIERAVEVKEYIDSWEGDDEDDELDEEKLWKNVRSSLNRCRIPTPGYQAGIEDRQRLGILQKINNMAKMDLLDFVLPKGAEISEREMKMGELPSGGKDGYRMGLDSVSAKGLIDRALINKYVEVHFPRYENEQQEGEQKRQLFYEQEYIINGKRKDRENLSQTVKKLLAVREGMNLIHILGDSEKREEARLLALALTGAAGVTPIADIAAFFIMGVWAFAESVEDVRALLQGEGVPLIKGKEDWRLNLDEIFNFVDKKEKISEGGGKDGPDYGDYLKGFLLIQDRIQRNERMMDLIQYNLSGTQESFRMNRCAVSVEAECTAKGTVSTVRKRAAKKY